MKNSFVYLILGLALVFIGFLILFISYTQKPALDSSQISLESEPLEVATPKFRYSPEGTSWKYNEGSLMFENGKYFADFDCNVIQGSFTSERTTLTFSPAISTKKACPPEIAEREQNFTELIIQMDTFTETDTGAILSGNEKEMILLLS